jgi:O-antigen/teichoic acid export membrane protein
MSVAWYRVVRIVDSSLRLIKQLLRPSMVRNVGALAAAQYVVVGLGFMSSIIETRVLGPTSYGTAVLIMAYPTLILSLVDIKSTDVTTRYMAGF